MVVHADGRFEWRPSLDHFVAGQALPSPLRVRGIFESRPAEGLPESKVGLRPNSTMAPERRSAKRLTFLSPFGSNAHGGHL